MPLVYTLSTFSRIHTLSKDEKVGESISQGHGQLYYCEKREKNYLPTLTPWRMSPTSARVSLKMVMT